MTNYKPPSNYSKTPASRELPSGTVLFRVHAKKYPASQFNPMPSHRYYGGGRFDATEDDPFPFMYASETPEVALAETLLRDISFDDNGACQLPRSRYAGRRISAIQTANELSLIDLTSLRGLSSVCQDTWLTECESDAYAQSRHWGHWIRSQANDAHGFVWRSRREPESTAIVLFGDRIPAGAVIDMPSNPAIKGSRDFDSPRGRDWLSRRLEPYSVKVN